MSNGGGAARTSGPGLKRGRPWAVAVRPYLMVAPAVGIVVTLFGGGLALGLAQSLGYVPFVGQSSFSLEAYRQLFQDEEFYRALGQTLWLSVASTALATGLAVTTALSVWPALAGQRRLLFLYQLNLPIPHLVGALGILFLIAPTGLAARWAYAFGLISSPADFPVLVYDRYGWGIILEYVWKGTVFIGTNVLAALPGLEGGYGAAARTLGASGWQRLRYVTLPLLAPSVLSASVLVLAYTLGAYETPFLLGQRYPSTLAVLAYRRYVDLDLTARPEAMALSILITLVSAALIGLYLALARVSRMAPAIE